jgi:WD40 repeat protein
MNRLITFASAAAILVTAGWLPAEDDPAPEPIAIKVPQRTDPVDFEKEILPLLKRNCLACHNSAQKESDLALETPDQIRKGGSMGAAVAAGKADDSLLLRLASRQQEPIMPPVDNDAGAVPFTPDELGLIKLWIDQGAEGISPAPSAAQVAWQPLPPLVNPVYAVAVTADGQYAACGRANQVFIYHLPTGRLVTRLTDPALLQSGVYDRPGVAHLDIVQSLAFSPDGSLLASGGYKEVKIWRRPRNVRSASQPAGGPVTAVATSRGGKWLAVASADETVRLTDLGSGDAGRLLSGHSGPVTALAFSADGSRLATAGEDRTLLVWNVADGTLAGRIDVPQPLAAVAFVKGGGQIVSAGTENPIRVWNTPAASRIVAEIPVTPTAMAASADRRWLAVAGDNGQAAVIDVAAGKVAALLTAHAGAVTAIAFDRAGQRLATAGADQVIVLWDLATGQSTATFKSHAPATALAFHPNGQELASSAGDGKLTQWKLDLPSSRLMAGDNGMAPTVWAASADGKRLVTGGQVDGKPVIVLWDAEGGTILCTFAGHEGPITALAVSGDSTRIVSGSADKTVRVWNSADGTEVCRYAGHASPITAVCFRDAAGEVVSAGEDASLRSISAADGSERKVFSGHTGPIVALASVPDGGTLVSASADGTARFWNPNDASQIRAITNPCPITALAASRDLARIALAGADNQVRVHSFADGALQMTLAGHSQPARSLAFSSDHARLVSAGADNQALVWDLAQQTQIESVARPSGLGFAGFGVQPQQLLLGLGDRQIEIASLRAARQIAAHTGRVSDLAWSADGGLVYSTGEDGRLCGWQSGDGQRRFETSHGAPILDLAQSSDGRFLATGGDKQIRVWNAGDGGGAPRPQFSGFSAPVRSVAFSADNQRVLGGDSAAGEILVFNLNDGELDEARREQPAAILGLAPYGEQAGQVLSLAADRSLRLWPLSAVRRIAGHSQPVTSLAAVPTADSQFVSGGLDGLVRQWNVDNGQAVRDYGHGGPVKAVAVRPDGGRIASAGANNVTRLWNAQNGQSVAELKGDLAAQIVAALRTRDLNRARARQGDAQNVLAAAEKDAPTKNEALTKAEESLAAAQKTLDEKQAAAKQTADAKVEAEKLVVETSEKAKKAQADLADAEKLVQTTTAKAKEAAGVKTAADKVAADMATAAQKAEEARKSAQAEADNLAAEAKTAADAFATAKKASDDAPDDKALADAKTAAEKVAADAETKSKSAADKAKTATGVKDDADKASAEAAEKAKLAAEAMTAADTAAADAVALSKTASESKAAADKAAAEAVQKAKDADKPAADAANAAKEAQTAREKAQQARDVAAGDKKKADDALALAKSTKEAMDARVTTSEEAVTQSQQAAAATEKPWAAVAFSPDNGLLAVAGEDALVHTYGAADGAPLDTLAGHAAPVSSLAFVSDTRLASGSADSTAGVWELAADWTLERIIGGAESADFADRVVALDFSPDGATLATGGGEPSRSGELKLWSVADGTLVRPVPDAHSDTVFGVSFSVDGQYLASGSADKFVKVFEVATGRFLKSFEGHTNHVLDVAWQSDGKTLASCGADSVIKVWSFESGEQIRTIQGFNKQATSIAFVGDTINTITSSGDAVVRIHRVDNGQVQRNLGGSSDFLYSVAGTPDGKLVIAGGQDSVLRVWNGNDGSVVKTFEPPK